MDVSTQVEILLGYLTRKLGGELFEIYTSRNSFRLLNALEKITDWLSTQVEILLGYLTLFSGLLPDDIYTSRNSFRLLNHR